MKSLKSILFILLAANLMFLTSCTQRNESNDSKRDSALQEAIETVDIKEWQVPWGDTRPRDPYVSPDGKTWFCGQQGNYLASFEPETEEFKRYEVEEGTHPHNLIIDDDSFVWYAGNQNAHIGRLDPTDGSIEKFEMPNEDARDPHTLVFNEQGNIWFTVQGGNFIGFLDTNTGEVRLVSATEDRSRPYGIKMDPKNRPWVVLFGTNKLATVNPDNFELMEIELPDKKSRPRRIEITSNGSIYYVDYSRGYLGMYSPESGEFSEWALPGGSGSRPYGTALDLDGRIWIAESGLDPNRLVGFNPRTQSFFSITEIPSGGGAIRHMYFHPDTNEIWFGTDTNTIGRASVAP